MTGRQGLRVLVAVDGSPGARAALAMTIAFPWPAGTRVRSVTAQRSAAMGGRPAAVRAGLEHGSRRVAARARRTLAQRWPDAEAVLVDQDPVPAILGEARRMRADVIVLTRAEAGTPPAVAEQLVQQCIELGTPRVWMHCSLGSHPMLGRKLAHKITSVSEEAVRLCRENNIAVIPGACPMMFCEPVDFGHKCMRGLLRFTGALSANR